MLELFHRAIYHFMKFLFCTQVKEIRQTLVDEFLSITTTKLEIQASSNNFVFLNDTPFCFQIVCGMRRNIFCFGSYNDETGEKQEKWEKFELGGKMEKI